MRVANRLSLPTFLFVSVISGGIAVAPAAAEDRDATDAEERKVTVALERRGYRDIDDVDVIGDVFEVDAETSEGKDVDVYLDRKTLKIVRVEKD